MCITKVVEIGSELDGIVKSRVKIVVSARAGLVVIMYVVREEDP